MADKPEDKKEPTAPKVDTPKQPTLIEQANQAAERTEKATADLKEQLDRQENMLAQQRLAGRADAGQAPEKPKETTPTEYMKEVLEGKHNEPVTEKK
ncbi:MAG: hypothetical protein KAJ19_26025 [Gammaproteobacteria bacterium]|nr:hypothetical protein [Gammaproteobacteria bacterium]